MKDPADSRKKQLEELKRLRKEGGTHQPALEDTNFEVAQADDCGSDYADADDLQDFIEDDEAGGKGLPAKREGSILSGFIKKPAAKKVASSKKEEKSDLYFQNLLQQLDADEESSSGDEPVDTTATSTVNETVSASFPAFDPALLNAEVAKQMKEEEECWDMDLGDLSHLDKPDDANVDEEEMKQKELEGLGDDLLMEDVVKENIPPPVAAPKQVPSLDFVPPPEGYVDFFWLDAHEKPHSGTVHLFGKLRNPADGSLRSCCLTITSIQRNLFFLPRETDSQTGEEVTLEALQEEVSELLQRHGIKQAFFKTVLRRYAFEVPDVPAEADWLKASYGFGGTALPASITGRTFSKVFGTNTSALELLLVKRKMMGPCWLRVRPSANNGKKGISWCRAELTVDDPKRGISVLINAPPTPPVSALSLSIRTVLNAQHQHEIVAVSGLLWTGVSLDSSTAATCSAAFTIVRDPEGVGFPARFSESMAKLQTGSNGARLEVVCNERALLSFLVAQLHKHDPDVLVGHNFLGFDLGVLLHRMKAQRVDFWSRLGRLNLSAWPKGRAGSNEASWAERQIVSGRLVCDTWLAAKEHVRAKNYSLATLVTQVLGEAPDEADAALDVFGDPTRLRQLCASPESLHRLLRKCERDALHQANLMFRLMILPLTKQLTCIAGNLWSRTLAGARAERNEFLLLHEFHAAKYICPDRNFNARSVSTFEEEVDDEGADKRATSSTGKRKPAYAGGLVLEPKRGFYDKIVLLLDFNSLYPSIIQEYNICFTTVARDESSEEIPDLPEAGEEPGVLPRVLKGLVEKRRAVKRLMKDPKTPPAMLAQYNIRQQALKLTANSMYGCLGFAQSRFYAKPLAMLITSRGRDILQSTVHLAQTTCHLDVIYGDTDSIMLHTGCNDLAQAKKLAQQVKRAVNERYRLLELELDGVFERLLLLRKKKYAALIIEEGPHGEITKRLETKGLDMVRRDWCALSVQVSEHCLHQMMYAPAGSGSEEVVQAIHAELEALAERIRASAQSIESNTSELDSFLIHKNLTKEPEAYADAKTQPHVSVALRMRERGMAVRAGDTVPYVICLPVSESSSLADRAFHPDEIKADPKRLVVDATWYLAQQILPPVSRLCECLEGTDSARIAMCLGLDSRKYSAPTGSAAQNGEEGERLMSLLSAEEKFKDVQKLSLTCTECSTSFAYSAPMTPSGQPGMQCPTCTHLLSPQALYCQVLTLIRSALTAYHQGVLQCDEPGCAATTQRMRVYESRCVSDTCRGAMLPRIPGSRPYYQLLYLRSLFDWEAARQAADGDVDVLHRLKRISAEYEPVRGMVLRQLNQCSFPIINLREVFSFMSVK